MKQNYLKTLSLLAADNLVEFESEIPHALKQSRCAEFFQYAISQEDLSMRLNRANFCRLRTVPCAAGSSLRNGEFVFFKVCHAYSRIIQIPVFCY
jgi:hypothetical protein